MHTHSHLGRAVAGWLAFVCCLTSCNNQEQQQPAPQAATLSLAELPERPVPGRVFLVAIDGATWPTFRPAMEAGVMPNLKRLTETGTHGMLKSVDPTASAIIWTTVVTGKVPNKHGILGFVAESAAGQIVPVSSNMRTRISQMQSA